MRIVSRESPSSVEWDFGDGGIGKGIQVSHRYHFPGTYTLRAKITDKS